MSMNSFSAKADKAKAEKSKKTKRRRSEDTVTFTATYTKTGHTALNLTPDLDADEIQELRDIPQAPIDLAEMKKGYQDQGGAGRRIAPRYPLQVTAVLFNKKGTSFRTQTMNVSTSGILLKDSVPADFMTSPFDIMLICQDPSNRGGQRLMFTGEAVGGPLRSPRLTFKAASKGAQEVLERLFSELDPIAS